MERELYANKSLDLATETDHVSKAAILRDMTTEDRDFVEKIDDEYYKRVKTSDEFYRRKKLILMHLDKLEAKVSQQAKDFDDYTQLKFIMLEKAKQKKSIIRNFVKLEDFKRQQDFDSSGSKSGGQFK